MRNRYCRSTIRQLLPGERVPDGSPRRYRNAVGYIRLRWLVGIQTYVEAYEHRVHDGYVVTDPSVHHINRQKDDNRPANLMRVTMFQHGREHLTWNVDEAIELYLSGWSTIRIGARYGKNRGNVSRTLRRYGVIMRPTGRHVECHGRIHGVSR